MLCVFLVTGTIILRNILIKRIFDNITEEKSVVIDFNICEVYILSEKKIQASNTAGTSSVLCIHLSKPTLYICDSMDIDESL